MDLVRADILKSKTATSLYGGKINVNDTTLNEKERSVEIKQEVVDSPTMQVIDNSVMEFEEGNALAANDGMENQTTAPRLIYYRSAKNPPVQADGQASNATSRARGTFTSQPPVYPVVQTHGGFEEQDWNSPETNIKQEKRTRSSTPEWAQKRIKREPEESERSATRSCTPEWAQKRIKREPEESERSETRSSTDEGTITDSDDLSMTEEQELWFWERTGQYNYQDINWEGICSDFWHKFKEWYSPKKLNSLWLEMARKKAVAEQQGASQVHASGGEGPTVETLSDIFQRYMRQRAQSDHQVRVLPVAVSPLGEEQPSRKVKSQQFTTQLLAEPLAADHHNENSSSRMIATQPAADEHTVLTELNCFSIPFTPAQESWVVQYGLNRTPENAGWEPFSRAYFNQFGQYPTDYQLLGTRQKLLMAEQVAKDANGDQRMIAEAAGVAVPDLEIGVASASGSAARPAVVVVKLFTPAQMARATLDLSTITVPETPAAPGDPPRSVRTAHFPDTSDIRYAMTTVFQGHPANNHR